jgi:putative NADH-flavin reductase
MNFPTTIALIGATGKAGKYLTEHLLAAGYHVKALVRKPELYGRRHPSLQLIEGNILNRTAVTETLQHCSAVLSVLGQGKDEQLISSIAAGNLLEAMEKQGISRYVFVCGLNIDVPGDHKGPQNLAKSQWMLENYPDVVADKQQAYSIVAASKADWTMVRLPTILTTADRAEVLIDLQDCPGENIFAGDLAAFLTAQLSNQQYHRKAPFIANRA